jgi:hypothetical protein
MIVRWNPDTNPYRGALSDFDSATFYIKGSDHNTLGTRRTGTLPYLALDLLSAAPPQHLLRHDLESCFWAFLWHAVLCSGRVRQKLKYASLQAWVDTNLRANSEAKYQFLFGWSVKFGSREVFREEIKNVCHMLISGKLALDVSKTAEGTEVFKTMDGHFTYELFMVEVESMIKKVVGS